MRQRKKIPWLFLICLLGICLLGIGINVSAAGKTTIAYKTSYDNTALKVGKTKKVYVVDSRKKAVSASSLTWTSTDKNVATVKNGVITAKKNGKTYITAQMKNSKSNTAISFAKRSINTVR